MRREALIGVALVCFVFLFFAGVCVSQPFEEWNKTYGGPNCDWGSSVQQTSDGGYISIGSTNVDVFEDGDAWLIKTDSNGNEEWNRTHGGLGTEYGYSGQQTSDGGYILAGSTSSYGYGIWLIKTDSNGNEEWNRTYGGLCGYSVQQTSDGGYILAGSYDYDYGYLIKTDSDGNEEWNRTYDSGSRYDSVQQTSDGGYIIAGYQKTYYSNVWLLKADSNGNEEWHRTYGGYFWEWGSSVQQTSDGGYIIVGTTFVTHSNLYLIKTDSDGNAEWSRIYGRNSYLDDSGSSVQQTSDGGYIIVGSTESYGAGSSDVWLIKEDSGGKEEWNITFGGYDSDGGSSVQQTSDGGYIITGSTSSYGAGGNDVWLIKVKREEDQPPTASFTYSPVNPIVNQTITFDASNSTDTDGTIVNYKWNFGDGNITNTEENIITHFYSSTGDYNVNLTVTDNDGAIQSVSKVITITIIRGDLNDDGEVTAADAAIALTMAVRGEWSAEADISGDNHVTSLDALMILQAAVGGVSL